MKVCSKNLHYDKLIIRHLLSDISLFSTMTYQLLLYFAPLQKQNIWVSCSIMPTYALTYSDKTRAGWDWNGNFENLFWIEVPVGDWSLDLCL